jgi:hypothetical protein
MKAIKSRMCRAGTLSVCNELVCEKRYCRPAVTLYASDFRKMMRVVREARVYVGHGYIVNLSEAIEALEKEAK